MALVKEKSGERVRLSWGSIITIVITLVTGSIALGGVLMRLDTMCGTTAEIKETLGEVKDEQVKFRMDADRVHTQLQSSISTGTADRWRKANDLHFMTLFAALNSLKMPVHERITNGNH